MPGSTLHHIIVDMLPEFLRNTAKESFVDVEALERGADMEGEDSRRDEAEGLLVDPNTRETW